MMDETPSDPVDALGHVVKNYLQAMGISGIIIERTDDNFVEFELLDALNATCVLPLILTKAELVYREAGLSAASSRWPVHLESTPIGFLGVKATWVIGPGAASWGAVYPCVMEAAHDLFRRDPMDPTKALVDLAVLLELEHLIQPAASAA